MVRAANTSAQDSDDSQIRDRNTTSNLMSEFLSACWGNVRLHPPTKLGSTVNAATVMLFKDSSPAPRLYPEPFTSHLLLRQKGAGSQRQAPPGTLVYRPRCKSTLCFSKKKAHQFCTCVTTPSVGRGGRHHWTSIAACILDQDSSPT